MTYIEHLTLYANVCGVRMIEWFEGRSDGAVLVEYSDVPNS
jgi:hypothetical protein